MPVQRHPSPASISYPLLPPVGGRLSIFWEQWEAIGADSWVLKTVKEGYQVPLIAQPPLAGKPIHFPAYHIGSERHNALLQAVEDMVAKRAIEPAQSDPGFYSRLFVVTKATGDWRPVIDLSALNKYVLCPSFKMETPKTILAALTRDQWLTSLDMKDAYFHILIHPKSRKLLRFCFQGKVWQFRALPFGLSTSPRVFTKVLTPVLAYAHLHGIRLHMYLDDWLLNPDSSRSALQHTQCMLDLFQRIGWIVNMQKCGKR